MQTVEYINHMGNDLSVVNSARVSFHKYHDNFEEGKDDKLINYLAKNGHWTPFSHTSITVRIKAPLFVRTQCYKHKVGFTENEISRRYVTEDPEFFFPDSWRSKPEKAKQGSGWGVVDYLNYGSIEEEPVNEAVSGFYHFAKDLYEEMLENGIAPEQARMVLPQSMFTEWWWTGSLIAFSRFYNLRSDSHAQEEIREIAFKVEDVVGPLFPISWEALTK